MPKNIVIQMHWVDVSSAVEIVQSSMVAKKEISILEKFKKFVKHHKYLGV